MRRSGLLLAGSFATLCGVAMAESSLRGPVHITADGVRDYTGQTIDFMSDDAPCADAMVVAALDEGDAAREIARAEAEFAREAAREARRAAIEAQREAREAIQETQRELRDGLNDARRDLVDAARDIGDMRRDIARMEAGDFSSTLTIDDGDVIKCGDPARHPGCAPYSEAEKAEILAEMRDALRASERGLAAGHAGIVATERALAAMQLP